MLKTKTTKKNFEQWNRKRRKIRERTVLVMDKNRVEMQEGNRRGREKIWLNIKKWVLQLTYTDCKNKKRKGETTKRKQEREQKYPQQKIQEIKTKKVNIFFAALLSSWFLFVCLLVFLKSEPFR